MNIHILFRSVIFLLCIFPNAIGFGLLIVYFRYFNLSKLLPVSSPAQASAALLLGFSLVIVFLLIFEFYTRSILKFHNKSEAGQLDKNGLIKFQRLVLNTPFYILISSAAGWIIGGFGTAAIYYSGGLPLFNAVLIFLITSLIGGSISVAFIFSVIDTINRRAAGVFFRNIEISYSTGFKKVSLEFRLIFAFFAGGVLPVSLAVYFSGHFFALNGIDYSNDLFVKFIVLMVYSIVLSLFMFFQSAIYFFNNVVKPLNSLEGAMREVERGSLDISMVVDRADEIGSVYSGFNSMLRGLRERERMREIFGKITSAAVRDRLLLGELELGGKLCEATILFCDIRNFTSISESMPPEDVVDLLNSYLNEMVKPVISRNGIIDKFIGDEIMAVFGPPENLADHANRAVDAAFEMIQKLAAFNSLREIRNESLISFGIGINSGSVIAGNIGSSDRMEYTVIGDVVNTASRLQTQTKISGTQIVISDSVMNLLDEKRKSLFRAGGLVQIRGKQEEVAVYTNI